MQKQNKTVINIPVKDFDEHAITNLGLIISSRATLIRKALGAVDLTFKVNDDSVDFPWFDHVVSSLDLLVYTDFCACLCYTAKKVDTPIQEEIFVVDEKYRFAKFLDYIRHEWSIPPC